jgi:hypothetical protein
MSGRRVRNVLLLAIVAGVGYWIYKERPTVSGIIDTITNPLMGSRAAVKSSERNRVSGDASSAVAEQRDSRVESLHEGMSKDDVRELLGDPDSIDTVKKDKDHVERVRWTYRAARRLIVFQGNRVVSISVL